MYEKKTKLKILKILKESKRDQYVYIASFFQDMDYFVLKKYVQELVNEGFVRLDQEVFQSDQIAARITPSGLVFLKNNMKNLDLYFERRVQNWLKVGILGSIAFMMALTVVHVLPGFYGRRDVYKAEVILPDKDSREIIETIVKNEEEISSHYYYQVIQLTEGQRHYVVICREGKECKHKARYFYLEEKDGKWEVLRETRLD